MKDSTKFVLAMVGIFMAVALLFTAGVYREEIKKALSLDE